MSKLLLLFAIMIQLTMRSAHGAFFLFKSMTPTRATPSISQLLLGMMADATTRSSSSSTTRALDPLIVCGPSGVGKGTIIERFMQDYSDDFAFTVSHTTRSPRPGEVNGVHYHFSTHDDMKEAIAQGKFLEHAEVHGNIYGTSWDSLEQPKRSLLDIDVQGVKALKEHQQAQENNELWQPRFIFIAPPSLDLLLERLSSRGTEDEASLKRRTSMAASEVEYGLEAGNFDAIVINDDLDEACAEFERVVQKLYKEK